MGAGSTSGKYIRMNSSITSIGTNKYRMTITISTSSTAVHNAYGIRIYAHLGTARALKSTITVSGGVPSQSTITHDFVVTKDQPAYASCICSYCEDGKHSENYSNFTNQTSSDTAKFVDTSPPGKPGGSIQSASKDNYVSGTLDGIPGRTYVGENTLTFYLGKPGNATSMTLNLQYSTGGSWYNYSGFPMSTSSLTITKSVYFGNSDRVSSSSIKQFKLWATATNANGTTNGDATYFRFNDIPTISSSGLSVNTKRTNDSITLSMPPINNVAGGNASYKVYVFNKNSYTAKSFNTSYSPSNFNLSSYGVSPGEICNISVLPYDSLENGIEYQNSGIMGIVRNSPPYFTGGTKIVCENVNNNIFYQYVRIKFISATDKEGDHLTYNIYYRTKAEGGSYGPWKLYQSTAYREISIDASFTPKGGMCQFGVVASDGLATSGSIPTIVSDELTRIVAPPAPDSVSISPYRYNGNYEQIDSVTWGRVTSQEGENISNYVVHTQVSSSRSFSSYYINSSTNVSGTTHYYNISNVPRGYYIRFVVYSKDSYGVLSISGTSSKIVSKNRLPNKVSSFIIVANTKVIYNTANLKWSAATDPDGDDVTYEITRSINYGAKTLVISGINTTSYIDDISYMAEGTKVSYYIRTIDELDQYSDYQQLTGIAQYVVNTKPTEIKYKYPSSKVHSSRPRIVFEAGYDADLGDLTAIVTIGNKTYNSATSTAFDKKYYYSYEYVTFTPPIDLSPGVNSIKIKVKDEYQEGPETEVFITYEEAYLNKLSESADLLISKDVYEKFADMINNTRTAYGLNKELFNTITSRESYILTTHFADMYYKINSVTENINKYSEKPKTNTIPTMIKYNHITKSIYNTILDVILNV